MTAHSNLGASSANRWMNCPGSNKLIEKLPFKPQSGPYALLGSAAHALAEYCLSFNEDPTIWIGSTGPIKDSKGREVISQEVFIDENMVEAVAVYIEYINDKLKLGGELFIETKFDLSHLHEGMFGTADAAIYNPMLGILEIVDYKHGQGVAVSPERNSQAMFYGLGALHAFDEKFEIDKIILTIVQPRAAGAPVKTWETTPRVLIEFGEQLKKAAQATYRKGAKLETGDWCKFCPVQPLCPKIKQRSLEVAQSVFNDESQIVLPDPKLLSFDQLKEILDFSDTLTNWLKTAEGFALELAQRGSKIPGYKLVQKRANRRWVKSEGAVAEELELMTGLPRSTFFAEPKFMSPAQIEKLKIDKNLVASLTETPDNGTTLALAEDRRAEVAPVTAQDVFLVH
jgi:hypothetical protein